MLNRLSYGPAVTKLKEDLWEQRASIEGVVRHHLALRPRDTCKVVKPNHWIRGGFNLCVFVDVYTRGAPSKVVFLCPMPHKLGEARCPGSMNEKMSTEIVASVWVDEHCPEIRAPYLFGFGFSDGRHFTHARYMPLLSRLSRYFWRFIHRLFRRPLLSQFVPSRPSSLFQSPYMVLEYIDAETGEMLSTTFDEHRDDPERGRRLFGGLSRIILSLARVPQPRIGSSQFNADGTVTLANRPLSCSMMILENDGAPQTIGKCDTYTCTDAYVSDLITFHDQRVLSQPNAVYSEDDCRGQITAKTLLRVLLHEFIWRDLRNGPFFLQLTDLNMSNILMLDAPYWMTGRAVDGIRNEHLTHYTEVRIEFMDVLAKEEWAMPPRTGHDVALWEVMESMWEAKGVWFWHYLESVNAMSFLLEQHLYPRLTITTKAEEVISRFLRRDAGDVVGRKMADKQSYDDALRKLFDE